jgi:hypothetical protein
MLIKNIAYLAAGAAATLLMQRYLKKTRGIQRRVSSGSDDGRVVTLAEWKRTHRA